MSPVKFRKGPCHVTNFVSHGDIGFMSHVDFKKWPCRSVDFKGQGPTTVPSSWYIVINNDFRSLFYRLLTDIFSDLLVYIYCPQVP